MIMNRLNLIIIVAINNKPDKVSMITSPDESS